MNTQISALLAIDAQRIYTAPESELFCTDSEKTIENVNRLIDAFSQTQQPIIFIRHIHAIDGSDLGRMFDYAGPSSDFNFIEGSEEIQYTSSLKNTGGLKEILKHRYSAFQGTDLDKTLKDLRVQRLVICGL